MPNQKTLKMEDMSESFVRALCAYNGYNVLKSDHDNDGFDSKTRADLMSKMIYSEFENTSRVFNR